MRWEKGLELLTKTFQTAKLVTILTGAGLSAASGIPTFRGKHSLWKNYRPEKLATPQAFSVNPHLVWKWYDWRRQAISRCQPNRAHHVLAIWSHRYPNLKLITQNVDGLHERAGANNIIRFRGPIWEVSCWNKCGLSPICWSDTTVPYTQLPPECPYCGGYLRPGVVWFGEAIDPIIMTRCRSSLSCDLFIVIGTSSVVHPAASLFLEAKEQGAYTVELNLETTPISSQVDLSLEGRADVILEEVEKMLSL